MKKFLVLILTALIFLTVVGAKNMPAEGQTNNGITCTVKDKYVKRSYEDDKYMVVCKEGETFTIGDSLINGNFKSTDLYNSFSIGDTIKITEIGPFSFRSGLLSTYRKITDLEVLTEE